MKLDHHLLLRSLAALHLLSAAIAIAQTTDAPTADYGDPEDDDTVNLRAVGGYYTDDSPRCVFPFQFNGKTHNGCLSPEAFPPHDAASNPAAPPPEGVEATTGGVLGWCPHNHERTDTASPIRFHPFDTYADPGPYKKLWGYCECSGGFFWQRLPVVEDRILDRKCWMKTLEDAKEVLRSNDCRQACDDLSGCQGFEFAKFNKNNVCRLFKCIGADAESGGSITEFFNEALSNSRYKQQIKRPCEEATVDFTGTPIIPDRNVTGAPTVAPTAQPTSTSKAPTPFPTDPVTKSPTPQPTRFPSPEDDNEVPDTSSPTGSPTIAEDLPLPPGTGETGGESSQDKDTSATKAVNPSAFIIPILVVACIAVIVAAMVVKRRRDREVEEEAEGDVNADETEPIEERNEDGMVDVEMNNQTANSEQVANV